MIKGIKINDQEIKQTFFADDATFFNDGSATSFKALVETLHNFRQISGLNLNSTKSTVMRIGSLKNSNFEYCKENKFIWTSDGAKTLGMHFFNEHKLNIENNLMPKIKEFEACLKQWHHRKLTLMGKVTVIKTFALPKLIYPFSVLPNPTKQVIDGLITTMFKFIWDDKPDKIKRKRLHQPYENGGLKLTDINNFLNAIKAGWVKRFLDKNNHGKWKLLLHEKLKNFGTSLIFESNLDEAIIHNISKENLFLKDILTAWQKIKNQHNCSQKNIPICKHVIWNNKDIKINNKSIFLVNWFDNGIKTIGHLYNYQKNTYYTFSEMQYLYNINPQEFLNYFSLLSAIPKEYKTLLYTQGINALTMSEKTFGDVIENTKQINKTLYNIQQKTQITIDNSTEMKWKKQLNLKENTDWRIIYTIPLKSTIDTYLRNFQYKFLSRIVPTNKFLTKCGLKACSLCEFCQSNIETIDHLFWECNYIKELWTKLQHFLKDVNIEIKLSKEMAFLGFIDKKVYNHVLNFILILMKTFIFNMKIKKCIPNFNIFLNYLKIKIQTEAEIALIKNKYETNNQKWIHFMQYFSNNRT